jgi:hypothetical protein
MVIIQSGDESAVCTALLYHEVNTVFLDNLP